MEMEDQYNMSDLRQLMNGGGRTHFPSIPLQAATELFPTHRPPPLTSPQAHHQQQHHHPYEQLMMIGRHQAHEIIPRGLHHHHEFRSPDSSSGGTGGGGACNNSVTAAPCLSGGGGLEGEAGGCVGGEGSGRWPRQETLTLLEIRSRLDFKFKEANQKGPLWDEVSRIMGEEHGYQRSGKKCREKFENLYKYYKKTKEGKAGRQDGKHYRFFRQLEALYGETTNSAPSLPDQTHFIGNNNNSLHYQTANNSQLQNQDTTPYQNQSHNKHCDSLSLSNNSSEFDTSSSENQDINDVSPTGAMDDDSLETKTTTRKRRGGGRGSWKAKIKEFIDSQMRKLMDKQEEWLERLMRTLEQKERERMVREEDWRKQEVERAEREHKFWAKERAWIEARDKALMEALHKLTDHHQEKGNNNNNNNNNISSSSPDDHDHQNSTGKDQLLLNKKRKENVNSRSSACYFQNNDQTCSSLYSSGQGAAYCGEMSEQQQGGNDQHGSNSPCGQDANVGNAVQVVHDNCFPFLMSEGENLWENYGLKLSKGSQNQ